MTKPSSPASPPSRPRSKTNCAGRLGVGRQREQRLGQRAAGAARVDGDDRLVAQARRQRRPVARVRQHQASRLDRARGDDDAIDRHRVDEPAGAAALEPLDAMRQADRRPCLLEPGERRRREDFAQPAPRQQQVGRAASRVERVVQDAQEDRAARLVGRRVERGDAERLDEVAPHGDRQRRREVGDGLLGRAAKSGATPGVGDPKQGDPIAPAPAATQQHGEDERRQRRAAVHPEAEAVGVDQGQRPAQEGRVLVDADEPQQAQRLDVGADADVRAVVEHHAVRDDVARPAAGGRRHLEQRHVRARARRLDRCREARPSRRRRPPLPFSARASWCASRSRAS